MGAAPDRRQKETLARRQLLFSMLPEAEGRMDGTRSIVKLRALEIALTDGWNRAIKHLVKEMGGGKEAFLALSEMCGPDNAFKRWSEALPGRWRKNTSPAGSAFKAVLEVMDGDVGRAIEFTRWAYGANDLGYAIRIAMAAKGREKVLEIAVERYGLAKVLEASEKGLYCESLANALCKTLMGFLGKNIALIDDLKPEHFDIMYRIYRRSTYADELARNFESAYWASGESFAAAYRVAYFCMGFEKARLGAKHFALRQVRDEKAAMELVTQWEIEAALWNGSVVEKKAV